LRDAIVCSGWSWETSAVPERIALALSHLGSKVLYVENPSSLLRKYPQHSGRELRSIRDGIFGFRPVFLGHRLNSLPLIPTLQSRQIASQIMRHKIALGLRDPLFFYPWMGQLWGLPKAMKGKGLPIIRMLLDYPEIYEQNRLAMADFTLLSPKCGVHHIEQSFSGRACVVPHSLDLSVFEGANASREPKDLAGIPRPRLCYLGPVFPDRLNMEAILELLRRHPEWHFVFFGEKMSMAGIPNAHALPWTKYENLPAYIQA
jgi:hypothetical protein